MAQYGVMRLEKVKGVRVIAGHQAEANRTMLDKDKGRFKHSGIDWDKTGDNVFLVKSENWGKDIDDYISENYTGKRKIRKDAVKLVEGVYTCSPERMQELDKAGQAERFMRDCIAWHEEHVGHVINAVWHRDEKTGHLHIASVPMKNGKLTAKTIFGNGRNLSRLQQSVEDEVFAKYGLDHRNVREPGQAKKHKIKAEHEAEIAEEKVKVAQNEQVGIEAGRIRAAEDLVKRNAVIDDEEGIEYKEPTIGKNYYKLTPEAYKMLRRTAQDGAAAASELLRVVPERDNAVTKLALTQRKQAKMEQGYIQKLTDLRKEACMYLDAPAWARQNLREDMEYYQRYRSDVDKGIVAAYCTAGDSLSHNDRLEVAGEYARPYMSRLRGEEVSKHDALEYSRQCVSECDRQVSGGRSSSPDGWHHRASDTDYSKAPETEDVKIPRLPKDEQSSDSVTYWPLLSVFEKVRRLMKEIRRMI